MDRRRFLATGAAIGTGIAGLNLASCSSERRPDRPNLIVLLTDQMRAEALGCMGNAQVVSPNIDRLAAEGMLFTNAISSQPACSPFRAQLMTGLYGHRSGVIHNDTRISNDCVTLGEAFESAGYSTGYIGKWHLSGDRRDPVDKHNRRGWDYWAVRNCRHKHFEWEYWENDSDEPIVVKKWEPLAQTDLALEFVRDRKDEPFALVVSYGPPHAPYRVPDEYLARYGDTTVTLRPNVPAGNEAAKNLLVYYAMITSIDDCVGRLVAGLDELGLGANTILCLTSDHGDMLGSQGHVLKQRPWEEAINIPLVIRYPDKVAPGVVTDRLVSSVDYMPTMLGLCGAKIPDGLQGHNQAPSITGGRAEEREDILIMNTQAGSGPGCDWRGVRTKQWTYAYNGDGHWLLYRLSDDPYQLRNLVDDPAFKRDRERLRSRVEDLRAEAGETVPLRTNRQVMDKVAPVYPIESAITEEHYKSRWSNT